MNLLSTPTVSSVLGEYNYFSAAVNVIITTGASDYCVCIHYINTLGLVCGNYGYMTNTIL